MEFDIDKFYLKSTSFFNFLAQDEAQEVKNKMQKKEYVKNDFLFKEKSYSKGIYIIKKGKVKIFQTNHEGKQSIVYIYKKGDYFGYRPLLANEPHPVSAVAMENVTTLFIPGELFTTILFKSSTLAKKLLITLSKEFSVWINKLTVFSQHGVKERVALSLLILNKVYSRSDTELNETLIAINRDDFASYVGTAKETLVRMLRNFKDDKIILTRGTRIILLKPKALLNIISEI